MMPLQWERCGGDFRLRFCARFDRMQQDFPACTHVARPSLELCLHMIQFSSRSFHRHRGRSCWAGPPRAPDWKQLRRSWAKIYPFLHPTVFDTRSTLLRFACKEAKQKVCSLMLCFSGRNCSLWSRSRCRIGRNYQQ